VSLLMSAIPLAWNAYGVAPVDWCWIRDDHTTVEHFEWSFFYAEVIVSLVAVFILMILGTLKFSKQTSSARRPFTRIMFFPLAFLLSYIGGLVNVVNQQLRTLCADLPKKSPLTCGDLSNRPNVSCAIQRTVQV